MSGPNQNDRDRGTPPKSAERIRAALQAVHENRGPSAPVGPRPGGMQPGDSVAVASFYDPVVGRKFQERLLRDGLMSKGEWVRGRFQVLVDAAERGQAVTLLAEVLAEFPDRHRTLRARIFDYAFFFAAIGATISSVGVVGNGPGKFDLFRVKSMLIVAGFTLYSAVIGALVGDLRFRLLRGGTASQFGIRDLMLLTALVALVLVLWHYVRWFL